MEINESDRFSWFSRGKILASFGKLEESLDCFDRAIALKQNYYEAWSEKGEVLEQLGRLEEADRCFCEGLGAFCYELEETLIDELEFLTTPQDNSPGSCYNQACFHAIQGNVERAIYYLKQAISYDSIKYSAMALKDADFNSIANDPRFKQLTSCFLDATYCPLI